MGSDADNLKSLEREIKALGWQKLAGSFFTELNADTLVHFNAFQKEVGQLRVQMHATSKVLNRISWRIFSLPSDFDALKEHLSNSCKCHITSSFAAREVQMHGSDLPSLAQLITQDCKSRGENFNSVDKIVLECAEKASADPKIDRSIELICGYIAQSRFAKAMSLVENKKNADFPGYGISFFAHAERFLNAQ